MNDILRKSAVNQRQDQTQLDGVSESKKKELITSDASQCLFHVQLERSY